METDAKDQGRAARDADGGCPQYAAPTQAPTRAHAYSQGGEGSPLTSVWRALIKRRTVPSSPPVPWASIGDRETGRAPAQITQGVAPCWDGVVSSTYHHFKNVSMQRRVYVKKRGVFRPALSASRSCKRLDKPKQPCASIGSLARESCSHRSKAASVGGPFPLRLREDAVQVADREPD